MAFPIKTTDQDLGQLLGNGNYYEVPPFQRDYAWEKDNWQDLWDDIIIQQDNEADINFMGFIVLLQRSHHNYLIIDGQQRLTTLSILILAAIHQLELCAKKFPEHASAIDFSVKALVQRFIYTTEPFSVFRKIKLNLNKNNNNYYSTQLIDRPIVGKRAVGSESNKLILECYIFFNAKINEKFQDNYSEIYDFIDKHIANKCIFAKIEVSNMVNASDVFMTLNSRGVRLSTTDLLKNHIFSLFSRHENLSLVEDLWNESLRNIGDEKFSQFFRYFWHHNHKHTDEKFLFRELVKNIQSEQTAFDLVKDIHKFASYYASIINPNDEIWQTETKEYLELIDLINMQIHRPLLLSVYHKYADIKIFNIFAKVIGIILFRYILVAGKNSKELEMAFVQCANRVANDDNHKDILQDLAKYYIDDDNFIADFQRLKFANLNQRNKNKIRYILSKLERKIEINWQSSNATIEHIAPENYQEYWHEIINKQNEHFIQYLGNFALMPASDNKKANNREFTYKKPLYEKSIYPLTKQLAQLNEFTIEMIQERQRQMAQLAKNIWCLSFGDKDEI